MIPGSQSGAPPRVRTRLSPEGLEARGVTTYILSKPDEE
jgi:hypothetical protein